MNKETEEKLVELYHQGMKVTEIGNSLCISEITVYRKLRKNNIQTKLRQWGSDPVIRDDIINSYLNGESGPSIANRLRCDPSTVTRILQRNKIQARPYATYDINDNFFNVIDTEEKAYTLGFFTADGCLTQRGVMIIRVADRDVIEKIKHAMGHTSPIRVIPSPSNRPHCKTLYGLEVDRRQLSIDLRRLGCVPNKSFCTYLSEEVPSYLHRHFIRGLFDGDGSITKNKKTDQVNSFRIAGTAKLLGDVLDIIRKETNIGGGIYPHKKIFYLSVCGRYQILRVLDWLYEDATIFMDRKHLRYQNFKKEMNNNGI